MDDNIRIKNRQKMKISSLSFDKEELKRFCDKLQQRSYAAADIEETLFLKNDQTQEQYEANLATLRESFLLNITVTGNDDEELFGTINEVFESPNFPDSVKSVFIDSQSVLRHVHKYYPNNYFIVRLDFTKPKILDFSFLPSYGTPNNSQFEVSGYDATWVNGVFSEMKGFIDSRSSSLSAVHRHSIYDLLLWLLGFPLSFWVCSRLSGKINGFAIESEFLESALYFYLFVANLWLFRVLFHYLRWVCPLVEYRSSNNKMLGHRVILGGLILGWFGQFAYDALKWAIS